jgi:hypothetical protein
VRRWANIALCTQNSLQQNDLWNYSLLKFARFSTTCSAKSRPNILGFCGPLPRKVADMSIDLGNRTGYPWPKPPMGTNRVVCGLSMCPRNNIRKKKKAHTVYNNKYIRLESRPSALSGQKPACHVIMMLQLIMSKLASMSWKIFVLHAAETCLFFSYLSIFFTHNTLEYTSHDYQLSKLQVTGGQLSVRVIELQTLTDCDVTPTDKSVKLPE